MAQVLRFQQDPRDLVCRLGDLVEQMRRMGPEAFLDYVVYDRNNKAVSLEDAIELAGTLLVSFSKDIAAEEELV